jgi:hypothetical protein
MLMTVLPVCVCETCFFFLFLCVCMCECANQCSSEYRFSFYVILPRRVLLHQLREATSYKLTLLLLWAVASLLDAAFPYDALCARASYFPILGFAMRLSLFFLSLINHIHTKPNLEKCWFEIYFTRTPNQRNQAHPHSFAVQCLGWHFYQSTLSQHSQS